MYVICFYWQGDRWQQPGYKTPEGHVNQQAQFMKKAGLVSNDLPSRYVNNLYQGVKKYASQPFKFVCFTNEPLTDLLPEVELRPFKMITEHGVLPRLYMFSKDAGLFGNQVLCLDLDVIITGSLKGLMSYNELFCARSKFKRGEEHKLDGDVMSFKAGQEVEDIFWKPFTSDIDKALEITQGRERYWMRHVIGEKADRWDEKAPNAVLSYKRHVRNRGVPENASIVSFHGTPRPHQVRNNWIKNYWK